MDVYCEPTDRACSLLSFWGGRIEISQGKRMLLALTSKVKISILKIDRNQSQDSSYVPKEDVAPILTTKKQYEFQDYPRAFSKQGTKFQFHKDLW